MAVVFDTMTYERADTLAAARTAFQEQSAPSTVEFDTAAGLSVTMEAWRFGEVGMFTARMSGNRMIRTDRHIRRGPAGRVALAVHERGIARFEQFGVRRLIGPGDLTVVDLDSPYEFGWSGIGGSRCIYLPSDVVRMSRAELAQAARGLEAAPLYDMMRRHIGDLCPGLDSEVSPRAGNALGVATLSLGTALLWSTRCPDGGFRHLRPKVDPS